MPGMFPGRPGGVRDEPLLDMLMERRPIPPGAPPAVHDVARMLAAAAGSAEPGELAGEAAALTAFTRQASPVGILPAARRPARRRPRGRPARGRLPVTAALVAVAAGLGSIMAVYAGVLPSPIRETARTAPVPAVSASPQKQSSPTTLGQGAHRNHGPSAQASPSGTANAHASSRPFPRVHTSVAVPQETCTPEPGLGKKKRPGPRPYRSPFVPGWGEWTLPSTGSSACPSVTPQAAMPRR